jgi:hypothetical protein
MTGGALLTERSVNPERHDRHEVLGQTLDLVTGKEVDGEVALGALGVSDRQAGTCTLGEHCVGVLDIGTDGVHSDTEESARRHEINRRSNVGLRLRFRAVLENLKPMTVPKAEPSGSTDTPPWISRDARSGTRFDSCSTALREMSIPTRSRPAATRGT